MSATLYRMARSLAVGSVVAVGAFAAPALGDTYGPETQSSLTAYPFSALSTRPAIAPKSRADVERSLQALQATLTELQQLQLQTKQAHWNVSGAEFYQLHLELQSHYEGVSKYADMVAQRMLQIGGSSDGRATTIVRSSRIHEIPGGFLDSAYVVAWFTEAYKITGDRIDTNMRAISQSDPTTANLLQTVETAIAEYQWQMRAFIQPTSTNPNSGSDFNNGKPAPAVDASSGK